jgi:hypothetical protein
MEVVRKNLNQSAGRSRQSGVGSRQSAAGSQQPFLRKLNKPQAFSFLFESSRLKDFVPRTSYFVLSKKSPPTLKLWRAKSG